MDSLELTEAFVGISEKIFVGGVSVTPDESRETLEISRSVTLGGILVEPRESGKTVASGEEGEVASAPTLCEVAFGGNPTTVSFEDASSSLVSISPSEDSVRFNLRLCEMETVWLPFRSTDSCFITTVSVTTGRVKGGAEVVVRGNKTPVLSSILITPSGNVGLVSATTLRVADAGGGVVPGVSRTSSPGDRVLPSTKESLPKGSVGYIVCAGAVALVVVGAASVVITVLSASV